MGGAELMATVPGFPYAIPNGAAELLKGHLNGLAFIDEVFGPGRGRAGRSYGGAAEDP